MRSALFLSVVVCSCASLFASEKDSGPKLSREMLSQSLRKGQEFLLNNQLSAGNFNYEYDFRTGKNSSSSNAVRQAGALWGLSLTHQALPSKRSAAAIRRGIAHFKSFSALTPDGRCLLNYDKRRGTGTMALVGLAVVDFLRSEKIPAEERRELNAFVSGYIKQILSLETQGHQVFGTYDIQGFGVSKPNSYYDGESLLFLVRAAKYAGHSELKGKILTMAEAMYKKHVQAALAVHPDSGQTKGFYQWGTMAFYEIFTSGWGKETAIYGDRIITMAKWMVNVHQILDRRRNTAYAYEGLIHAWEVARLTGDKATQQMLAATIDQGLYRLTTWQVDGPAPNEYLLKTTQFAPISRGGILNHSKEPLLRIDVTQHQMHAVALALQYIYKQ